ncbi:AMP-binding protein [Nonomuraea guangzhouensis]|uniref:AMP-binding protein n=1 Tax=Nonomuraea guangzhouensis TaxID=1291555 RepID=A0ABW4FZ63_9ACTN|nr:AMP-binding protein [Nonomuraea guangzhouensis]
MTAGQTMRCGQTDTRFARPSVRDSLQIVLRLRGHVDLDALGATLTTFLERHGIPPEPGPPFAALDLSGEPHGSRQADAMVSMIVAEESLTELTSAFRCWLVSLAPDDHVLSLLLRRGYAGHDRAEALFQELPDIYAAVRAGRPVPPGAPLSDAPSQPVARVNREIALSPETARALRAVSGHLGADLATLVRAAFAAVLGRMTGRDRIVVTTPGPGRPITVDVAGDPRFPGLLDGGESEEAGESAYRVMFESLIDEEHRYGGGRWDDELHAAVAYADTAPASVDAALVLYGSGDRLRGMLHGHLRGDVERFPAAWIDRVARALVALLDAVADNADRTLTQLLDAPEAPTPADGTAVHELVAAWAEADPRAVAVLYENTSLTYGELDRCANRLAHRLRESGVRRETVVGVRVEPGPDLVIALLAIWKAGGCCLPLSGGESGAGIPVTVGVDVCLDDPAVLAAPATPPAVPTEAGLLAAVLPGAGGAPVLVTHEALVSRFTELREAGGLEPGERVLHKAPPTADEWVWELVWPLTAGACVVIAKPGRSADLDHLTDLVETQQVNVLHFSPSEFHEFVHWDWLSPLPSLRLVVCGDDGPRPDDVARLQARHATVSVVGGVPYPGARAHVLGPSLRPVPAGAVGELYVGGAGLARGYRHAPGLTAERFVADPFAADGSRLYRTGRRARWRADGILEPAAMGPEQTRRAPGASVESTLAAVLAEVLGVTEVGTDDDFFELGGDSITSVQVVSRARQAGLELTSAEIFDHPTLGELAALARPYANTELPLTATQQPALRTGESVTTLDALIDHCGAAGRTPADFPLAGLDQAALDLIQKRHGSLS